MNTAMLVAASSTVGGRVTDGVIAVAVAVLAWILGRVGKASDVRAQTTTKAIDKLTAKMDELHTAMTEVKAVLGPVVQQTEATQAQTQRTASAVTALDTWRIEHEKWARETIQRVELQLSARRQAGTA